jgi:hypothetical protein
MFRLQLARARKKRCEENHDPSAIQLMLAARYELIEMLGAASLPQEILFGRL